MKMKKLVALLLTATMAFSLVGCGGSDANQGSQSAPAQESTGGAAPATPTEKQDVSLRMWGAEEDQTMLQGMIDAFVANYADVANITVELGVESEADAKDDVLTDIEAAADVYAFASDQIADLYKAGALQNLEEMDGALQAYAGKSLADVKAANIASAVEGATVDGKLYAFPMTGDNGFFMFYDASVLTADDVKTWKGILDAAQAAGKKVGMTFASGWYNAAFFYGAGFTTGLNEDGTTTIDWNGTSPDGYTGVQVTQAMLDIASHPAFMAIPDGQISQEIASGSLCAVISGNWDQGAVAGDEDHPTPAFAQAASGKLPAYEIDGKQVQTGSVIGFKFVAVNAYSKNVGWATLLADWITNEENQVTRFNVRAAGPSNINAGASDAVQANLSAAGIAAQAPYASTQSVGGKFWDPTATFGQMVAEGKLNRDDTAAIQAALDELVTGVTAPLE